MNAHKAGEIWIGKMGERHTNLSVLFLSLYTHQENSITYQGLILIEVQLYKKLCLVSAAPRLLGLIEQYLDNLMLTTFSHFRKETWTLNLVTINTGNQQNPTHFCTLCSRQEVNKHLESVKQQGLSPNFLKYWNINSSGSPKRGREVKISLNNSIPLYFMTGHLKTFISIKWKFASMRMRMTMRAGRWLVSLKISEYLKKLNLTNSVITLRKCEVFHSTEV